MSVIANNILAGAAGQSSGGAAAADEYVIPKSLRFTPGDSAHLNRTPLSASNRRTWTWSGWVKLSAVTGGNLFAAYNGSYSVDNFIQFYIDDNSGRISVYGSSLLWSSKAKLRDPSAWYHIVLAFDTTQSTADDRLKVYINGVQTGKNSGSGFTQNEEYAINNNIPHRIGTYSGSSEFFNGLMADVQFVDGQQLAPTDFGKTRTSDGVWVPKEASFTSVNNGTTWSSTLTLSSAHSTNTPVTKGFDGEMGTGNTGFALTAGNGTIEWTASSYSFPANSTVEVWKSDTGRNDLRYWNVDTGSGYGSNIAEDGNLGWLSLGTLSGIQKIRCVGTNVNGYGAAWAAIRINGEVLIDGLNNKYGKNGFHLKFNDTSRNEALGYDSSVTAPDLDPKKGMDIVTWTGNSTGMRPVGGLGFEPDMVWIKRRNATYGGVIFDTVRGMNSTGHAGVLYTNATNAEDTGPTQGVRSFNPDGFSLGTDGGVNYNGSTYVGWCWRAGGPAVANSNGDITSQVSANNDYGFSIVKWTNNGSNTPSDHQVGHGLNGTPDLVIVKCLGTTSDWAVYSEHFSNPVRDELYLNNSNAKATAGVDLYHRDSTTVGFRGSSIGSNGNDQIAYCWKAVSGFSKFGTWTGTGSASGNKITTGFKPRFLMWKRTDTADNWAMVDSERSGSNPMDDWLGAAYTDAESTNNSAYAVDFLEDGFELKATHVATNASNGNYIYMCFADRPGNNWDVNNLVTNEGLSTSKDNFDVVTWTGNGSTQSISSLNFQPDLVWYKQRDSSSYGHDLFDSIRGVNNIINSNNSFAEYTESNRLTSFNSNGFTLGSSAPTNGSGGQYVGFCWKAGGTASSNSNGSITSSVSANPSHGFSVVSYTGTGSNATVGHGLNAEPGLLIIKNRSSAQQWDVYHKEVGYGKVLRLNSTAATATASDVFPSSNTSSVFKVGSSSSQNGSSNNMIAYCFANVPGYQRISSYTGTGSSGNKVVLGFKPRFLMIKSVTNATGWWMWDTTRGTSKYLYANATTGGNTNDALIGTYHINPTNDGFTIDNTADLNQNNVEYIYLAIGDDEIGSDEDCLVDVPNAVTADADETDTTGGYQRGNYATMNPLVKPNGASFSNGNLKVTNSTGWHSHVGTIGVTSGKWYYEFEKTSGSYTGIGWTNNPTVAGNPSHLTNGGGTYNSHNGTKQSAAGNPSYGATWGNGDTIGVAFDRDAGTITFYKNGVSQGQAFTGMTDGTFFPEVQIYQSGGEINFGQRRFKYPIPSGYKALNTTALPAATIADGSTYFNAKTYSGVGGTQSVTGLGFSPELLWIKRRDGTQGHIIVDVLRGSNKEIRSNSDAGEATFNRNVTSFDSDGFSLWDGQPNTNGASFIAWAWDAGSTTDTNNTDGDITPAGVRANASAGFSIVTFTQSGNSGQTPTVGHGLNAAPEMILLKSRGSTQAWRVYHSALGVNKTIALNLSDAAVTPSSPPVWSVSSSTFGAKNGQIVDSGLTYVAYCFAPVAGYSAMGSATGTGTTDGPFCHTGFRPAFVMYKRSDGTSNWFVYDSARDPSNPALYVLSADNTGGGNTYDAHNNALDIDFLSNGFKVRSSNSDVNTDDAEYIWYAVAENPFQANGGLAR